MAKVMRMATTTRTGVDQIGDPHQAALPRPAMSMPSCSGSASADGHLADDATLVQHDEPVGQGEQLVEILGHEEDRGTLRAAGQQLRAHVLGGPDVEAARRLRDDEHARVSREDARQQDLLDVAARQGRDRVVRAGHGCRSARSARRRARGRAARRCARRAGSRRGARGPGCRRPTGHRSGSRAGPPGCARRRAAHHRASDRRPPARRRRRRSIRRSGRRMPDSTSTSSVWPLPDTPATPTISPAATSSDTSRQGRQPVRPVRVQVADAEDRLAARGAAASAGRSTPKLGRPTIMRASSRSSVRPCDRADQPCRGAAR